MHYSPCFHFLLPCLVYSFAVAFLTLRFSKTKISFSIILRQTIICSPLLFRNCNCHLNCCSLLNIRAFNCHISLHNILKEKFSACRATFVNSWIRDSAATHYISFLEIDWDQISKIVKKLTDRNEYQGIGLLNFNDSEIDQWKQLIPDAEHVILHLDYVSNNITWESLYPEWIDEEEEFEVPTCPSLPKLKVPGKPRIDLVAVKLPCNKSESWSRDVARFHLQLEAARIAASSKGYHPVRVLILTDCFPIPNLFICKELLIREGNVWLFQPNLNTLRNKLQLPIGSCELAVPLKAKGQFETKCMLLVDV